MYKRAQRGCSSTTPSPHNLGRLLSSISNLFTMCKFRRVRNVYKCGHAFNLPDEEIKCDAPTCKFSPAHPPTCLPPQCLQTCWQYHQWPELYSPHRDTNCPDCPPSH